MGPKSSGIEHSSRHHLDIYVYILNCDICFFNVQLISGLLNSDEFKKTNLASQPIESNFSLTEAVLQQLHLLPSGSALQTGILPFSECTRPPESRGWVLQSQHLLGLHGSS